jgi:ribosomal protein L18
MASSNRSCARRKYWSHIADPKRARYKIENKISLSPRSQVRGAKENIVAQIIHIKVISLKILAKETNINNRIFDE